jgi:hypothetical protein
MEPKPSVEDQTPTSRIEWVAQGLAFEAWVSPCKWVLAEHPGLKSETWATHSTFVRGVFHLFGLAEGPSTLRSR